MESRPGFSAAQVLACMLATLVVTALATHWIDVTREVRHDEVTGRELAAVTSWLDDFYASPEGLQRAAGLCEGGRLDRGALQAWVYDGYMGTRKHASPQDARAEVVSGIQSSEEWKSKHR